MKISAGSKVFFGVVYFNAGMVLTQDEFRYFMQRSQKIGNLRWRIEIDKFEMYETMEEM